MWERWDGWTPGGGFQTVGMNSFNHYAFGSVGEYLYGAVGGIQPAAAGYKSIRIQPVIGPGLTWANIRYDSTRGMVSTAWTNAGGKIDLETLIPPNTTARVFVPTVNASAVTESGIPAANSPGVTFIGESNQCAIYAVGSGRFVWSSIAPQPPGPSVIISTTNQVGTGSGAFVPPWTVVTNGSLIAGKLPSSVSGNFSMEPHLGSRHVRSLTDGGSLAISTGGSPVTTSPNYVTCGNGNGSGSMVTYTLTGSATGYNLTNIVVYGGWGDNGRDQQAYSVYYSTIDAPAIFKLLTRVNVNPAIANNLQSATRVSMSSSTGVLARAVAALRFDFTNPASENGYCGYGEITVFGTATPPPLPLLLDVIPVTGTPGLVFHASGLAEGGSYVLQSTTNLSSTIWAPETHFVATQPFASFTGFTSNSAQKFYRLLGN